jgi:hypothetical protein
MCLPSGEASVKVISDIKNKFSSYMWEKSDIPQVHHGLDNKQADTAESAIGMIFNINNQSFFRKKTLYFIDFFHF